ncbi:MAG: hypothetical protein AB1756_03420 [Acidobacteriota bacterium]
MGVLLIFLDGVGVGQNDPSKNPFAIRKSLLSRFSEEASAETPPAIIKSANDDFSVLQDIVESDYVDRHPSFRAIFNNFCHHLLAHEKDYVNNEERRNSPWLPEGCCERETYKAIDATLGVPGIPQSATGQASLLTGMNVPQVAGGHLAGLPNQKVRDAINRESIFLKLSRMGLKAIFANGFTEAYFKRERPRVSATTQSAIAGGVKLRTIEDVKNGKSLYHDFTNFFLKEMGYELKLYSPQRAGETLVRIASEHDFTLYEYFITDIIGHKGGLREASIEVAKIDLFMRSVLDNINLDDNLVIVTSDHGNLEDSSIKTHTLNRVPLLCWGKNSEKLASGVDDISAISNSIISILTS